MVDTAAWIVDGVIGFIVSMSVIIGFVRGATKEILSIVSWGGSAVLSTLIFPYAKGITRQHISHGLIADFVTACVLFVVFLTILSVFNYICSNFVRNSALSSIDKFLGGVFGVLRGVVVVAVIDLALNQWLIGNEIPECFKNSKLRPHIMKVANTAIVLLPDSLQDKIVDKFSKINKENLLMFMTQKAGGGTRITSLPKEKQSVAEAKPILREQASEQEREHEDKKQKRDPQADEARKLATLEVKSGEEKEGAGKDVIEAKPVNQSQKSRLDMDRILDQKLETEEAE